MMAFGLGVLGLAPTMFWAMTPRELDAALAGRFGRAAASPSLSRARLDELMLKFPDEG